MANGRGGRRKATGRDAGGFIALPWSVLDSAAYQSLSHPARSLLLEIARQYVRDNNGKLLCSMAYLNGRGWTSRDVVTRAKRELLDAGLIFETCKGARPNKATWLAVTWHNLDRHPGYDPEAADFRRSAYMDQSKKILRPSHGTESALIGPSHGIERPATVPSHGPIEADFAHSSIPSHGHHLDKPSTAAKQTRTTS